MANKVDFNCDMGESFGMYKMGLDEEVIKHISSANIACGFHAGDPGWMRCTVGMAEQHNVGVGAHPSFPDLKGFGRRNMMATPEEVKDDVVYQLGALQAFTKGKKLQHVKPHGALYNRAVADDEIARAICEAILELDSKMILLALAGSSWVNIAKDMGLRVAREAFADRPMNADGTLVPRSQPGSVRHDPNEVIDATLMMAIEGKAIAYTGEQIEVEADSFCLHGDNPGAVEIAKKLRKELESSGVQVAPLAQII